MNLIHQRSTEELLERKQEIEFEICELALIDQELGNRGLSYFTTEAKGLRTPLSKKNYSLVRILCWLIIFGLAVFEVVQLFLIIKAIIPNL